MNNMTKILIGLLALSFIFNIVFSFNTKNEFEKIEKQHKVTMEKKEKSIQVLERQLEQEKEKLIGNDVGQNEDISKTELGIQDQYKDAAVQFIHAYLDYAVQNKGERRTNLLKMMDEKIVNILAPETEDVGDPNFKSSVNDMYVYIEKTDDISKQCEMIIDVSYTITGSENGKTTLRSFVKITLEKNKNDMKVTSYNTYPVK